MTLEGRIRDRMDALTAAERKVATALLADYPFAGLLTLVELAKRARASSQTILRLISKLEFRGYGEFQRALIGEIKESYHSPLVLHEKVAPPERGNALLRELTETGVVAIQETMAALPERQFFAMCALLADRKRSIFLIGGRMTNSIATYLFRHLRQIRSKVYAVPEYEEEWPEYLLRMGRRDVVLMFDCRRYQPSLERLASLVARERGAKVVLFTDKWLSPVSKFSTHTFAASVDVGTPWDTSLPLMLLAEAVINGVSESDWATTRTRIERWDELRATDAPMSNVKPPVS